ncbi:hypothetical protein QR680_013134 [Steinernema hermaphroditum]|uniref:SWIM-type domain-containing protein n=1 Tax=Steinernema hermaphroditum TaxID=289476 RepID=A0AA39M1R9_9BILA|nr:hypothetical protein QR680_013134 [Steinernema hermaphroditum]
MSTIADALRRLAKWSPPTVDIGDAMAYRGTAPVCICFGLIYNQLVAQGGHHTNIPKDKRQVKNIKQGVDLEKRLSRDGLYNIISFHKYLRFEDCDESFIDQLAVGDRLSCRMFAAPLIKEFLTVASSLPKGKVMQLTYDTQFEVGDYYLSTLTYRHPLFKGNPIIPLAYVVHDRRYSRDHRNFFSELWAKHPALNRHRTVFITDQEFDFEDSIPNVKHVWCWNHVKRNFQHYVNKVKHHKAHEACRRFNYLTTQPTEEQFDQVWATIKQDGSFKEHHKLIKYVEETVIPKWKQHAAVWQLKRAGIENPLQGITSNAAESMNHVISSMNKHQEKAVDVLATSLYFLTVFYNNEIARGYHSYGGFELRSEYSHVALPRHMMPELPFVPQDIVGFVLNDSTLPTHMNSAVPQEHASADPLRAYAESLIRDNRVAVHNKGIISVQDRMETCAIQLSTSKERITLKCSCKVTGCAHVLAAQLFLNVQPKDAVKNSSRLREQLRIASKQKPSGRKIPRREDLDAIDDSNDEEEDSTGMCGHVDALKDDGAFEHSESLRKQEVSEVQSMLSGDISSVDYEKSCADSNVLCSEEKDQLSRHQLSRKRSYDDFTTADQYLPLSERPGSDSLFSDLSVGTFLGSNIVKKPKMQKVPLRRYRNSLPAIQEEPDLSGSERSEPNFRERFFPDQYKMPDWFSSAVEDLKSSTSFQNMSAVVQLGNFEVALQGLTDRNSVLFADCDGNVACATIESKTNIIEIMTPALHVAKLSFIAACTQTTPIITEDAVNHRKVNIIQCRNPIATPENQPLLLAAMMKCKALGRNPTALGYLRLNETAAVTDWETVKDRIENRNSATATHVPYKR